MAEGEVKIRPPEIIAGKYYVRTQASKDFYRYGVHNPKRSPTAAALAAAEDWHARVSATETLEKWKKRRAAAGDAKYYVGVDMKGVDRYPKGCEIGAVWMLDFMTKFKPHLEEGLKKVYAMPKRSLDDAVKRAEAMIRHNATFTYEPSPLTISDIEEKLKTIRGIKFV